MAYTPVNWQDYPSLATAINAANLNHMEAGILAAYVAGTGGLTNADIAAAAGIVRSKLNFGSGLVDADIASGAAIAPAKVAPGSNTQVLTTTGGVAGWATPVTPAPGLVVFYDSGEISSAVASFDITSIPQTSSVLRLIAMIRSDQSSAPNAVVTLNGDSATHYRGNTSGAGAAASAAANAVVAATGNWAPSGAPAGDFTLLEVLLAHYRGAQFKTLRAFCTGMYTSTNAAYFAPGGGWTWEQAAAVNRFTLSVATGNFATGSRVVLLGEG